MRGLIGILALICLCQFSDAAIVFSGPGTVTNNAAAATVAETSTAGTTLFAFTTSTEGTTPTYAFATDGNPGSVAVISGKNVNLVSSKSIDYETTKQLVFKITGTDTDNSPVTLTVTLTITNRLEFSKAKYGVCATDGATAGTVIATYTVADAATGDTVAYTRSGTTDLDVDGTTGVLKVAPGKTLSQATTGGYTVTITATASGTGASAVGSTDVWVAICSNTCSGAGQMAALLGVLLLGVLVSRGI